MSKAIRILVVEDDQTLRTVLSDTLALAGYDVQQAADGEQALACLRKSPDIDLLLSDVQMSPMDGEQLLQAVRQRHPALPVVLMTAYGTVEKAVEAMRGGASDYLVKPFEADALLQMVRRVLHRRPAPEKANAGPARAKTAPVQTAAGDDAPIAVDPLSREMMQLAKRVAATDVTVMITGESGVGKEVVARYIHRHSARAQAPFIAINCAAIPENMLESVLFGYEKGAFTGACQARAGKFEQAQGGTLLLDEITEMDLGLQAKLLRVLQEREVERLGGRAPIALDVRIIATTNRDFHQHVQAGHFREDLFYRLNVFPINIQPLRKRVQDILPLAESLIARYSARQAEGKGLPPRLTQAARDVLVAHHWPGNVRELDNVIQRALILCEGDSIDAGAIHFEQGARVAGEPAAVAQDKAAVAAPDKADIPARNELSRDLLVHEKDLIISALASRGSRKAAAEKLGISPRTLRYKLARLREAGIAIPV